jgi:hypothetical protein
MKEFLRDIAKKRRNQWLITEVQKDDPKLTQTLSIQGEASCVHLQLFPVF